MESYEIMKFTKTAKSAEICKTIDKINENYTKGCMEGLP